MTVKMVNTIPGLENLPIKQALFIKEYLASKNATQSYRKVYNCKETVADANGSRLLHKARIKAIVDEQIKKQAAKLDLSAEWVLSGLKTVAGRCMQAKPKMEFDRESKEYYQETDEDGNKVFEFDSAGANRSLELLGKHLGIFQDKTEHTFPQLEEIRNILSTTNKET